MNRRAITLIDLIKKNNSQKVLELGVWRGETVEDILRNCDIKEYWAVDHWRVCQDGVIPPVLQMYVAEKEEYHLATCGKMLKFPSLRVMRLDSIAASQLFPKDYLDLIFIDADHGYEAVKMDIKVWTPIIKEGGIICGHDYGRPKWPGVKKAVDEIFGDQVDLYPGATASIKVKNIWLVRKTKQMGLIFKTEHDILMEALRQLRRSRFSAGLSQLPPDKEWLKEHPEQEY